MRRRLVAAVMAWSAFASQSAFASEDEEFRLEARSQNGVIFLSGGVGADERDAMLAVQREYTLWLSFEQKGEHDLSSDTEVRIHDARGKVILETVAEGPWLMVKLPAGHYRVTARQDDAEGSRSVTVRGKGTTRQVIQLMTKETG